MRTTDVLPEDLLRQARRLADRHRRRLGSEADDLAREAVVRALASPAPGGAQAPWLGRIFQNLLADHGRRQQRRAHALAALPPPPPPIDPERALLAAERQQRLQAALPAIPAELRTALCHRFADQDDAAVARAAGVTVTTVRTRVHRALARLRTALGDLRGLAPIWLGGPQAAALALVPLVLTSTLGSERVPPSPVAETAPAVLPAKKLTPPPAPPVPAPAPTTRPRAPTPAPRAVTRIEYGDDEVVGDLQRPDAVLVVGPAARVRESSLIEIPRSFVPSLVKMIEDL